MTTQETSSSKQFPSPLFPISILVDRFVDCRLTGNRNCQHQIYTDSKTPCVYRIFICRPDRQSFLILFFYSTSSNILTEITSVLRLVDRPVYFSSHIKTILRDGIKI